MDTKENLWTLARFDHTVPTYGTEEGHEKEDRWCRLE